MEKVPKLKMTFNMKTSLTGNKIQVKAGYFGSSRKLFVFLSSVCVSAFSCCGVPGGRCGVWWWELLGEQ